MPDVAASPVRRELHFKTLDDVLADLDELERGPRTTVGVWSGGQIFEHLARFVDCSLDGFTMTLPWWMRLLGKLFKKRLLNGRMPAGIKNKGEAAAKFNPQETSWEDGVSHYRRSVARLKAEPQRKPSCLFGELSIDEWNKLHCRHAELHLSFIRERDEG